MGFLDKLLGRKPKDEAEGMQTAPEPETAPEGDTREPPQGEEQRVPGEGTGEQ